MFGEPVRGKAWAWLLTGHHLGATFTCADDRVTAAPLFLGAQPLEDLSGPYAGFVVLSHERLRGLDLVNSLHSEQAKVAVVSTEPFFFRCADGGGAAQQPEPIRRPARGRARPITKAIAACASRRARTQRRFCRGRKASRCYSTRGPRPAALFVARSDQRLSQPLLLSASWTTADHRIRRSGAKSRPHHHARPAKRLRNGLAGPAL